MEMFGACHPLNFNVLFFLCFQIFIISQAEPRLPLQLEDAVRPDGDGEEVRMNVGIDEGTWKAYFTQGPQYRRDPSAIFTTVQCELLSDTQG